MPPFRTQARGLPTSRSSAAIRASYAWIRSAARASSSKAPGLVFPRHDVPAEHWKHVLTANPIESTFATVRLRTDKTKGCLSCETALAMVFLLTKSAERHWRRLNGSERLVEIARGVRFRDGEPVTATEG